MGHSTAQVNWVARRRLEGEHEHEHDDEHDDDDDDEHEHEHDYRCAEYEVGATREDEGSKKTVKLKRFSVNSQKYSSLASRSADMVPKLPLR